MFGWQETLQDLDPFTAWKHIISNIWVMLQVRD